MKALEAEIQSLTDHRDTFRVIYPVCFCLHKNALSLEVNITVWFCYSHANNLTDMAGKQVNGVTAQIC